MTRHRPTKYRAKPALMNVNAWRVANVAVPLTAPATQMLGLSEAGSL